MTTESKYKFTETLTGFVVEGKDRNPVTVELRATDLRVRYRGRDDDQDWWLDDKAGRRFGFYEYYDLSRAVAEGLMAFWEPPARADKPTSDTDHPKWGGVREWAVTQTAGAVGGRVHTQWRRLLKLADPTVLAVHRAVFAATRSSGDLIKNPAFYRHPYLVSDVLNYRAAAIAVYNAHELLLQDRDRAANRAERDCLIECSQEYKAIQAVARRYDLDVDLVFRASLRPGEYITTDYTIQGLADWQRLFSSTFKPYRSLRRTLMNLPGNVPHGLVCALGYVHLERPIFERLELLTVLWYANLYNRHGDISGINGRIFQHARTPQIKEALRRVSEHTHNELSPRRARDVRFLVSFLLDYPERHGGSIVGLADRAIRWHREQREAETTKIINQLGAERETYWPPISLPDEPGVEFLSTVADVCNEGLAMEHCLSSYAEAAVRGECFLFHVEREGERATVAVNSDGVGLQAHGPRNRRNVAARWGERLLRGWGHNLSLNHPPF